MTQKGVVPIEHSYLPIDDIRQELESAWSKCRNFILRAPTGSGKSTRVPRFLFEWEGFSQGEVIIILQPRRMAARLLAQRVAFELGESIGDTVGYQIRFDSVRSGRTRLLYVTEGLLLRWLIAHERRGGGGEFAIDGVGKVGAILFDEFHERHLEGDISLALSRRMQSEGWSGRIGVFSATLETGGLRTYFADAEVLESEGRQYPVDVEYLATSADESLWERASRGVKLALSRGAESDILVFQPGKYEIMRTIELLEYLPETKGWQIYPLHGELDSKNQDRVIEQSDRPRIIVSTNIAETSVTLPGIRTVVDTGMVKLPGYDPRRGVNTLLTESISRASADQRAGRAGRVAPGKCFRLWALRQHEHRLPFTPPEIERLDLSETRLQLTSVTEQFGEAEAFPWFERPNPIAWKKAGSLLRDLGALSGDCLTDVGVAMARLPLHPRLSRMLLAARRWNCMDAIIAAISLGEARRLVLPLGDKRRSQERDTWWEAAEGVSDLLKLVLVWEHLTKNKADVSYCRDWGIHVLSLQQAGKIFNQLKRFSSLEEVEVSEDSEKVSFIEGFSRAILLGYIDQLGRRIDRGTLRCELIHGRRGLMARESVVDDSELFVAADLEEREVRGEVTLLLGGITAVKESWMQEEYPQEFRSERFMKLNLEQRRVQEVEKVVFRDLVLRERELESEFQGAERLLADGIIEHGWILKKWSVDVESWIRRLNLLATKCPELEISPITAEDRRLIIEQVCQGATHYKQVKDREIFPILFSWVPDNLLPLVDEWVPMRFLLPTGSKVKLRYEEDGTVVLPARIQQLYDLPGERLRICQGKCALKIEILAPNGRPVQITDDLDGFWTRQYPQIRKDLFGRYPKHEWR